MQDVGQYLQIQANSLPSSTRDAFARSAYNRYYYGCFLLLRSEFEQMDPRWRTAAHKDYPDILQKSIKDTLTKEQKKARRRNDYDLDQRISRAKHALTEIAELMTRAYAVRVVADYEPQVEVQFSGEDRFSLTSVDITTAHNWQSRVETLIKPLRLAWSQIHG